MFNRLINRTTRIPICCIAKSPFSLLSIILTLFLSGCVSLIPISEQAYLPEFIELENNQQTLTLMQAVCMALHNNPEIRAKHELISVRYWEKYQASLSENPSISYIADPSEWAIQLTATISSLIDIGAKRQRKVDAAQYREEQSVISLIQHQIKITEEVRKVYAELIGIEKIRELIIEKIKIYESLIAIKKNQTDLATSLDLLDIDNTYKSIQLKLNDTLYSRTLLESHLNNLMGMPIETKLKLDPIFEIPGLPKQSIASKFYNFGTVNNPEIAAVVARIKEHCSELQYAKLAWIPRIEGGPNIGKPEEDDSFRVGGTISIELPVFDRGQGLQCIEESHLRVLSNELLAIEAKVILDIQSSLLKMNHDERLVEFDYPQILKNTQRKEEIISKAIFNGTMAKEELLNTQVDVLDIRIALIEALVSYRKSQAVLASSLGIIE